MRAVYRARQVLTGRGIQFTFESNRAAALLAFGPRTIVVGSTLAAISSAAATSTPASVAAFAAASIFAAGGKAAFAAGFARLLPGTAAFTAETASLTARTIRATWTAWTASTAATFTALTLLTFAASLAARAMSGARAGGSWRGLVAAEQALEPAHEPAWLFCLDRRGGRRSRVTGSAGFKFTFFPTVTRVAGLAGFALLARVAWLTGLARIAGGALIT